MIELCHLAERWHWTPDVIMRLKSAQRKRYLTWTNLYDTKVKALSKSGSESGIRWDEDDVDALWPNGR